MSNAFKSPKMLAVIVGAVAVFVILIGAIFHGVSIRKKSTPQSGTPVSVAVQSSSTTLSTPGSQPSSSTVPESSPSSSRTASSSSEVKAEVSEPTTTPSSDGVKELPAPTEVAVGTSFGKEYSGSAMVSNKGVSKVGNQYLYHLDLAVPNAQGGVEVYPYYTQMSTYSSITVGTSLEVVYTLDAYGNYSFISVTRN